ncbi:MAG: exonuclease SbcCD subunit D [Anaerolineaceae bacterium]
MLRILHFADAHIDMAGHGRIDPESGLPVRVIDFLTALDTIVDTAINEKVDLVLFAGDTYKDRSPAPTYQREWGRRMMRLSQAGIPTLLLVGNHDLPPSSGRANAMQEYDTLQVPHLHLVSRPSCLRPDDLEGLPLQVIAIPWITRSAMMAELDMSGVNPAEVYAELGGRITETVEEWIKELDPDLPTILTAHASVQGAVYGGERSIMLGRDVVLPGSLVKNPFFSYTALGHIHKSQDLNKGSQPPVIYPGSIEKVDFGEAGDDKFFVIASIEKGRDTVVEWRKLHGRRFLDRSIELESETDITPKLWEALPNAEDLEGAVFRLILEYPRRLEPFVDEKRLRDYAAGAFEFHLVRRVQKENRLRLPGDRTISSVTPHELLDVYLQTIKTPDADKANLLLLADVIIRDLDMPGDQ